MPEMHFVIRWPDGDEARCYSPSLVVLEYLEVGRAYPVPEFMQRSRAMLNIGSERVRAKYGYACSAAMDQLQALEARAGSFTPDQQIVVTAFELPAPV
jgi:uncharacterized repeat protein (TIGR04042 family)